MKRLLLISLISLVICSFAKGEDVKWYSWNEGYELAKKENRPIMFFAYAPWCNMCKRMQEKTFTNKIVAELINQSYIPIRIDVDAIIKGATEVYKFDDTEIPGKNLLMKFLPGPQIGLPTTVLWMPGTEEKKSIAGLLTPDEIKTALDEYMKK